ncbi:MAG: magnesium transporter, partial [Anaerolineales bacterium]|nr:magnesium transporter [Anaerolineales bacterium]
EEEATEDIHRLGGSEPLDQPYFAVSAFDIYKKRIGWLLLLFFAGTLTGYVTTLFEGVWGVFTALTIFVPLVIGTGGNAGSQTIATIIRAITLGEVKPATMIRAWRKELFTGLMLGTTMCVLAIALTLIVWQVDLGVALAVAFTLPVVVMWAVTIGTIVPVVADRIGIDPTVVSGPMISTLVDATGLAIYYTLAGFILGVF